MTRDIWVQFEHLKLEYTYGDFQRTVIKNLLKKKSRDLGRYSKRRTRDHPLLIRMEDQESLVRQNTIFLRNSSEFWEAAQEVTEFIKPVLYHYSFQQFGAFFVYTMFKWPMPSSGHGIRCQLSENIEEIGVEFRATGFFKRLLDTFIVLGRPTAYGSWIPLGSKEGVVFKENTIPLRIPTDRVKLTEILDFKPLSFAKAFKSMHPNAHYDRGLDYRLTDYLVIFIASNIARYRPNLWRMIISGRSKTEARFNLRVKTAYVNYVDFLECIWLEFEKWKS